jgi:replicative superfamily II helicase
MKIIPLSDAVSPVSTSAFEYASFPFSEFNIVQSVLLPIVEKDCNILIASATSSGKTVMSEMFGSYEIRKNKKKVLFLCPLRALASEKYNDWSNPSYHFSDLDIGIYTGDYRGETNSETLEKHDIIIMTSEMLNHKIRNSRTKNDWIKNINCVIIDESHLLTVPGRGDHLESAIINFSLINQTCRFVLLSATLPNVEEVAEWFAQVINKKETYVLRSNHRPCPLKTHIVQYDDESALRPSIHELIDDICKCVSKYSVDKFLIFVHAKKIGEMIVEGLARRNIVAGFHNANLDSAQRTDLENKFKQTKESRVMVATSTLAWGVNLAARRVIIAGATRGPELVPSYDILQMMGRAGRPPFDTEGDAHIFLPASRSREISKLILTPQPIQSRMLDVSCFGTYDVLAFHIVYEISVGKIKTKNDIIKFYDKTFASLQKQKIKINVLNLTLERLTKGGVIYIDDVSGEYDVTTIGKVSALFYYNPFDLSNLSSNFTKLFKMDKFDDIELSLALANTSTNLIGSLSKQDKLDMQSFLNKIEEKKINYPENVLKIGYLYNKILNGRYEARHGSLYKTLQNDLQRLTEVLRVVDTMSKKWGKGEFFKVLAKRSVYGVPAKLVGLIEVKGIGKIRAEKLYNNGIKNKTDIINNIDLAASVAGVNKETLLKSIQ